LERLPEVNSGLFAVRTNLLARNGERQPVEVMSLALDIFRQGHRLIYEELAVGTKEASPRVDLNGKSDRARTTRRLGLTLPRWDRRRGFISAVFWMHCVLRRFCPAFLIAAFVANSCLLDDPSYLRVMLFHELFYVAALIALYVTANRRRANFRRFFRFLGGKRRSSQRARWSLDDARAIAGSEVSAAPTRAAR
jgi:hypothetical protein